MWQYIPQNSRNKDVMAKRWVKSPISRGDTKWRLRRDIVVLWWNPSPCQCEIKMYPCGETRNVTTLQGIRDVLSEIAESNKSDAKVVVFANHLDALWLGNVLQGCEWIGNPRLENDSEYHFCAVSDKFEFRNLDPILDDYAKTCFCCDDVYGTIGSFGIPLYKIVWSVGHLTKKSFFDKDLREILWQDTLENKRFFHDMQTYLDMFAGSSSGFLWIEEELKNSINVDVSSYDIKSAYAWALAVLDKYPLTAPIRSRKISDLYKAIEKDKWFLIVIRGVKLPSKYDFWMSKYDDGDSIESLSYAINYYDYMSMCLFNYDISEILIEGHYTIYTAKKCGRLHKAYRDRIVSYYNTKESIQEKEDPNRKYAKKQLELLYGKPLQWHNFSDIKEVQAFYRHRGDNYVLPHWSKLAISAIKYRLMRVWRDDGDCIYADTDGVKSKADPEKLLDYFTDLNGYIVSMNVDAGYRHLTMGMWDHEYVADRFIFVNKKQYAYEVDGEITTKITGVLKVDLQIVVNECIEQGVDFLQELRDGLCVKKHELTYIPSKDEFIWKPYDMIIGKDDYKCETLKDLKVCTP